MSRQDKIRPMPTATVKKTISLARATALALEHLDGSRYGEIVAYYDDATRHYWASDAADLVSLGEALHAGEPDAYSNWCTTTTSRELDPSDIAVAMRGCDVTVEDLEANPDQLDGYSADEVRAALDLCGADIEASLASFDE